MDSAHQAGLVGQIAASQQSLNKQSSQAQAKTLQSLSTLSTVRKGDKHMLLSHRLNNGKALVSSIIDLLAHHRDQQYTSPKAKTQQLQEQLQITKSKTAHKPKAMKMIQRKDIHVVNYKTRPSQIEVRSVERRSAGLSSESFGEEQLKIDDSFSKSPQLPSKSSLQQKPEQVSEKIAYSRSKPLQARSMVYNPAKTPGGNSSSRGSKNLGSKNKKVPKTLPVVDNNMDFKYASDLAIKYIADC